MIYGHHVRDLLLELKRSEDGATSDSATSSTAAVPSYNDAVVTLALQDFKLHEQALQDQVQAASTAAAAAAAAAAAGSGSGSASSNKVSLEVRPSMLLHKAACERHKRGLLAYHTIRLQRIQELYYWQHGETATTDGADHSMDGAGDLNPYKNLCPAEADFLSTYQEIVARYTAAAMPEITDLRAHCTAPPLTVDRVLCRVVDDTPFAAGPIVLESGQTVHLTAGSTHYLIYADCEEYVRSGALQLLDTEE
jgi:hypothetical protein